ncbi:DUF1570 domain-containing protein [bacterium]|nr:DUF1570 domain-containing protein [bacterium]
MIPALLLMSIAGLAQVETRPAKPPPLLPPAPRIAPIGQIVLDSPSQEFATILAEERAKLTELAEHASDESTRRSAAAILKKFEPLPEDRALQGVRFELMPEVVRNGESTVAFEWNRTRDLRDLRDHTIDRLWKLASKAAFQERFRVTDQALRAIVSRDVQQPEAWRVLGYVAIADGWATPYAMAQLERGRVLHPRFGWLEKDWVEPLDQGQLPIGKDARTGKIAFGPADEANAAHAEWSNAWEIVTEHFRIRSDVPFDEAVAFGRKLEAFHQFFFSWMADLIGPELPLAKRWRAKLSKPVASPVVHHVAYFARKEKYVEELTPLEGPSIAESIGYYRRPPQAANSRQRGGRGMSYFFQDKGGQLPVEATLYHEASHQLLFEMAGRDRLDSNRGHYWLFEGLGTCFETLKADGDNHLRFGLPTGPRMDVARNRILDDKAYTPYEVFEAYGKAGFESPAKIYDHYAQAMALTLHFLMHPEPRTRDIFLDYARDAYKGRLRGARGLAERLGLESGALDQQFIDYLKRTASPST